MDDLEGIQKYVELDYEFNVEPVKLLKDRGDVGRGGGSSDNVKYELLSTCSILVLA